ncbi:MAG: hypothetical protein ACT4O9_14175 [Blastocatellia bacterium]
MRQNHFNITIVLLFFVFLILGCTEAKNARPAAEFAIAEFHERFNHGQIGEIYHAAHSNFKAATTEDEFNKLMNAVTRKLGKVKSTTNQNWNVKAFNLTTTIVMVQNTEFEQGKGTETFTFAIDGEKAVLLGYYINSSDLIFK